MPEAQISANGLVERLLALSQDEVVCILDSCGAGHLDSHLVIAGIRPLEVFELRGGDVKESLDLLDEKLTGQHPCFFTLSYDFGRKMLGIPTRHHLSAEPDVFLASFDSLITHDYDTGTMVVSDPQRELLDDQRIEAVGQQVATKATSNFTRLEYIDLIGAVLERIRAGDTYQTNLTQQLSADLPPDLSPQYIFRELRKHHPAPFAAFMTRSDSTIVSASPERFLSVDGTRKITTSPIKGTRPRGATPHEDQQLCSDLLASEKDIAENTMIVDLLRNDLGRVCKYGSVVVERLCELEQHPTFFDLVSTISGDLRPDAKPSDILRAMFPCGSITGAPKISTMKIIDELETEPRGLSMGAIGCYIPEGFAVPPRLDLSVAIRTMVIRDGHAVFNVGGGITIGSTPESEWDETLTKATALLDAIGGRLQK